MVLIFLLQEKAEKVVLDVIDEVFPTVLEKVFHSVPQSEKVLKLLSAIHHHDMLELVTCMCSLNAAN